MRKIPQGWTGGWALAYRIATSKVILTTVGVPFTILGTLSSHILYRVYVQTPDPIEIQGFPDDTPEETKSKMISQRRTLVQDFMNTSRGFTPMVYFLSKHVTDDIEYEDCVQRVKGREQFRCLVEFLKGSGVIHDVKIHGEYHGPHEILVDQEVTASPKSFPSMKQSLRMRAHFLLEPPSEEDNGGPERLSRYCEELNGNRLLDQNSTFAPIGWMHSGLRGMVGRATVKMGRRWSEAPKKNFRQGIVLGPK